MIKKEIPWKVYNVYLPVAEKIYQKLFPEPKSLLDSANKVNIKGDIIRILLENEESIPMFCKINHTSFLDKDNILWKWVNGLWIGLPSVQTYFLKRVWVKDLKKEVKKYEDEILKLSNDKQLKELKEWKKFHKTNYSEELSKLENKINNKIGEEDKKKSKKVNKKDKFSNIDDWKIHMNKKYNKK